MTLIAIEMNVSYISWNWPENLQENGMAMHILMTAHVNPHLWLTKITKTAIPLKISR
jgi:hypothetical protein